MFLKTQNFKDETYNKEDFMIGFNWLDGLIVLGLLLFGLMGFIKGFTQRILSLLSWGGAIALSFKIYPFLKPLVTKYIAQGTTATVITSAVLFITLLVLFKLLTTAVSNLIHKGPLKGLDRMLGIIFGIGIGALVVSLTAMIMHIFFTPHMSSDVMRTSKLWPFVLQGEKYVEDLSPLDHKTLAKHNPLKDIDLNPAEEMTYPSKERSELDHLLNKVDKPHA